MNKIIDIRTNSEYQAGHIPNAINIEKELLLLNPNYYLNKEEKYYLYCTSGFRSEKVVTYLNKLGYNTINIPGGYNNYLLRK